MGGCGDLAHSSRESTTWTERFLAIDASNERVQIHSVGVRHRSTLPAEGRRQDGRTQR